MIITKVTPDFISYLSDKYIFILIIVKKELYVKR